MRIAAVGDITAFHREPESGYEFAGPVLADFDVVFAQNERLYSRTTAIPDVGFTELTDPDHVAALKLGHFDVMLLAEVAAETSLAPLLDVNANVESGSSSGTESAMVGGHNS